MAKCNAKTQSGKPCKMQAIAGGQYCFTHAPEVGAKRAQARKRGGERHRTGHYGDESLIPREVVTLADANKILAYTLAETVPMENSIARARLLLALYDSFVKSFEIGELEKRIQALEIMTK
jgi:hypothetical protein